MFNGDVFTIGELADQVTGGNSPAMARMLNDAGLYPRADETNPDPGQGVPRKTVINLAAQRASDRVGRVLGGLLATAKRKG